MGKVETKLSMIGGVPVEVPVGPIVEPSAAMRAMVRAHESPRGSMYWKMPLSAAVFGDSDEAKEYAEAVDFYHGGHEWSTKKNERHGYTEYVVNSKGYYHYVGA